MTTGLPRMQLKPLLLALALPLAACSSTEPLPDTPDAPDAGAPAPDAGGPGGSDAGVDAGSGGGGTDAGQAPIDPTGGQWSEAFGLPGVSGVPGAAVRAFARDGEAVYAGGEFVQISGVSARGVARWTGRAWEALGEGLDLTVNALAMDGDTLWAGGRGGDFGLPGPVLFGWDGRAWSPGPSVDGEFPAVESITRLSDGRLVVGGRFDGVAGAPAPNLAVRGDAGWGPWGSPPDGPVFAVFEGADGRVCIGGQFGNVGDRPANNVACWDARARDWAAMGDGLPGSVFELVAGDVGGEIYAGGNFTFIDRQNRERAGLARWDGTAWQPLAGGVQDGELNSVRALARDAQGRLLVGGHFATLDGYGQAVSVSHLGRWDGRSWTDLGGGVSGGVGAFAPGVTGVYALLPLEQDDVLVGGMFLKGGETTSQGVARFDGAGFTALADPMQRFEGVSGFVNVVALDDAARVYIGGGFGQAGQATAHAVARWENEAWAAVGDTSGGYLSTIAIDPADQTPWIAGEIELRDRADLVGLARLAEDAWQPMGEPLEGEVGAILFHSDGDVYVAGGFVRIGGVDANSVARFDGTDWHQVGTGLRGAGLTAIADLAEGPNGEIYATGIFDSTGDGRTARAIAMFDGTRWTEVGGGLDGRGADLEVEGDLVYLAGTFATAGGQTLNSIARWDGTAWSGFGDGFTVFDVPATLADIEVVGGTVFATGAFGFDNEFQHIAWWNGAAWVPLGDGLSDLGESMVARGNSLWVGGPFGQAGGRVSVGVARWDW